jgi:hypothetical protein
VGEARLAYPAARGVSRLVSSETLCECRGDMPRSFVIRNFSSLIMATLVKKNGRLPHKDRSIKHGRAPGAQSAPCLVTARAVSRLVSSETLCECEARCRVIRNFSSLIIATLTKETAAFPTNLINQTRLQKPSNNNSWRAN